LYSRNFFKWKNSLKDQKAMNPYPERSMLWKLKEKKTRRRAKESRMGAKGG